MTAQKSCFDCGASFPCGCGTGSCWCADYPAVMPLDFSRDCRCPDCLAKVIGQQIEERLGTLSHPEALQAARPYSGSARLIEHIDFTCENESVVFTRWYLLKQGACCGNGCRNCPYPKNAAL